MAMRYNDPLYYAFEKDDEVSRFEKKEAIKAKIREAERKEAIEDVKKLTPQQALSIKALCDQAKEG